VFVLRLQGSDDVSQLVTPCPGAFGAAVGLPPGLLIGSGRVGGRPRPPLHEDRPGRHVRRVVVKVPEEALVGEQPDPMVAGLDIQVGGLLEGVRRRREEDHLAVSTHVGDGDLRLPLREVLECLDAGDQVVIAIQLLTELPASAVGPEVGRHRVDAPFRDLETPGVDASRPQLPGEWTDVVTHDERRLRPELRDDAFGDVFDEKQPGPLLTAFR